MNDATALEERISERIDKTVTGQLAVSDRAGGLAFTNASQALEFAKMMAISGVAIPKHLRGNPGACLAIVIQAIEWRLSPYAVANKSYSVNDRLAYESQLIQAVILQRAPLKGRFKVEYDGEGDDRRCRVSAKLKDTGETVDYTSPPIARINPKNSPLWKTDPDQQQFYYSGRALCRRHFPDVLLGVYARDELEIDDERDPEQARDVTPTPKTLADKLDVLAAAKKDETPATAKPAAEAAVKPTELAPASEVSLDDYEEGSFTQLLAAGGAYSPPVPAAEATVATSSAPIMANEKRLLKQLAAALGSALEIKAVQRGFSAFVADHKLGEGSSVHAAALAIRDAHLKRVGGQSSPSETDQSIARVLA